MPHRCEDLVRRAREHRRRRGWNATEHRAGGRRLRKGRCGGPSCGRGDRGDLHHRRGADRRRWLARRRRTGSESSELLAKALCELRRGGFDRLAQRAIALETLGRGGRVEQRASELREDLGPLGPLERVSEAAKYRTRAAEIAIGERELGEPAERLGTRLGILRRLLEETEHRVRVVCTLGGARGRQSDLAVSAETEQVAVDRVREEMNRLGPTTRRERALGETERDERLRTDRTETGAKRALAGARRDDVLGLGEEERAERQVLGLERRVARQPRERCNGALRVFERACATKAVLETAREELRRRDVGREACRVPRANERRVGVSDARRRLGGLDEHLTPRARIIGRGAGEVLERGSERDGILRGARDLDARLVDRRRRRPSARAACSRTARAPSMSLLPSSAFTRRAPMASCSTGSVAFAASSASTGSARAGAFKRSRRSASQRSALGCAGVSRRSLLELGRRILEPTEALLEDRGAAEANRAERLLLVPVFGEARGAAREMLGELVVARARDEERLDRDVGLDDRRGRSRGPCATRPRRPRASRVRLRHVRDASGRRCGPRPRRGSRGSGAPERECARGPTPRRRARRRPSEPPSGRRWRPGAAHRWRLRDRRAPRGSSRAIATARRAPWATRPARRCRGARLPRRDRRGRACP